MDGPPNGVILQAICYHNIGSLTHDLSVISCSCYLLDQRSPWSLKQNIIGLVLMVDWALEKNWFKDYVSKKFNGVPSTYFCYIPKPLTYI